MTVEEAADTRAAWISTFKEMRPHMNPEKALNVKVAFNAYGMERSNNTDEDEEDEDADNGRRTYMAKLPCGQIRNRCSYNAACNTQFQGTVAVGAKLAGWALVYNGYGDRLLNFVHDEYLYWLWPHELKTHIPIIEKLMIDAMKIVIPDVKVGVESSCMLHWDKKATEFSKLQWTPDGLPILEEPPFVKQVLTQQ
jgi:DNA polymerase I-like protein with 3'-5' exonuclease and polymerase domains